MPLATQENVRDALRRELTENEEDWVNALILEAGDLVEGYLHPYIIPSSVPDPIRRVVAGMVAAVFNRPTGILPETQSLTADSYGIQFAAGATSPGPYLTEAFKKRLAPFKKTSASMELTSEHDPGADMYTDYGISPRRTILITRGADRVITVRRRNANWDATVAMYVDTDTNYPTQIPATINGDAATIRLESTLLDTIRDGTTWRVIMSQAGSPTLETAVMVGTFKRADG